MRANPAFLGQPERFWTVVQTAGDELGYKGRSSSNRGPLSHSVDDVRAALGRRGAVEPSMESWVYFAVEYMAFRAELLQRYVEPALMNREQASAEYSRLLAAGPWSSPTPLNQQAGETGKDPRYLTGMVNILTEAALGGYYFNANPQHQISLTIDGIPSKMMSRRLDGIFPITMIDPRACWEIKEYYGGTSGSRINDGLNEIRLDGHEIWQSGRRDLMVNYAIVDGYDAWWKSNYSLLCQLIDILHKGLVTELLFGRQVLTDWPAVVRGWFG